MSKNLITNNLPYIIGSCLCAVSAYTAYQQYTPKQIPNTNEASKTVASNTTSSNLEKAQVSYKQGMDFYKQGNYTQATTAYTKTLNLEPNFAPAYTALGLTALKLNKTDQAIEHANKSIAVNKTYTPAYVLLGQIYQSKNQAKTAQEWYEKALAYDENLFEAHLSLLQLHGKVVSNEAHAKAMSHAKKALTIKPFHKETMLALGNAHLTVNNLKTAQTTYELTLEQYPDCYAALVGMGAAQQQGKNSKDALTYFKRAYAVESNKNLKIVIANLTSELETKPS